MTSYGFDLLFKQLFGFVESEFEWLQQDVPGASQIERLLILALEVRTRFSSSEYNGVRIVDSAYPFLTARPGEDTAKSVLFIQPQAHIGDFRVDFLISAVDWSEEVLRWRRLVVECDGHSFHERTKEQATKDRSRDRALVLAGYEVFRFTGSELWRDPWACAQHVFDWAMKGWPQ